MDRQPCSAELGATLIRLAVEQIFTDVPDVPDLPSGTTYLDRDVAERIVKYASVLQDHLLYLEKLLEQLLRLSTVVVTIQQRLVDIETDLDAAAGLMVSEAGDDSNSYLRLSDEKGDLRQRSSDYVEFILLRMAQFSLTLVPDGRISRVDKASYDWLKVFSDDLGMLPSSAERKDRIKFAETKKKELKDLDRCACELRVRRGRDLSLLFEPRLPPLTKTLVHDRSLRNSVAHADEAIDVRNHLPWPGLPGDLTEAAFARKLAEEISVLRALVPIVRYSLWSGALEARGSLSPRE